MRSQSARVSPMSAMSANEAHLKRSSPLWRAPKKSPGPRWARSALAISKPSPVSVIIFSRESDFSLRLSERRMQ